MTTNYTDPLGEEIVQWFGEWYITPTALIYRPSSYDLTIANLTNGMDWLAHLREKRWFTPGVEADFCAARDALLVERELFV